MLDSNQIATHFVEALGISLATTAFGYARNFYKDLNAMFGKIRCLESRVTALESGTPKVCESEPKDAPDIGNATRT